MRLELGRRADYAIRATILLARGSERTSRVKARAIADEMAIPVSYVPQILAQLVRAGIVESTPGPTGGYRLARAAGAVSLLDVVEAVEVTAGAPACILRGGPCRWDDECAVHAPWLRAQDAAVAALAETTFAELVTADERLDAADRRTPAGTHATDSSPEPHPDRDAEA